MKQSYIRTLKSYFNCRLADSSLAERRTDPLGMASPRVMEAPNINRTYWFSPQNVGAFSPSRPHPR